MKELDAIEELRQEIRTERISSIRFRLAAIVFIQMYFVPQFVGILHSMNVELPAFTKLVLAGSDIMLGWWFVFLPAGAIGWRTFETMVLVHQPLVRLRWIARLMVLLLIAIVLSVQLPLMRGIHNVG
jgi:general secretion pathway protein F